MATVSANDINAQVQTVIMIIVDAGISMILVADAAALHSLICFLRCLRVWNSLSLALVQIDTMHTVMEVTDSAMR